MKHAEIAKALQKAIEPFVRELALELTEVAAKAIAAQLDAARVHAVTKLREQLEGATGDDASAEGDHDREELPRESRPRGVRRARAVPARADRHGAEEREEVAPNTPPSEAPVTKTRKPMSCSKCGTVGFTASTCGKTHNVQVDVDEEGSTTPTPPLSKPVVSIGSRASRPKPERAWNRDDDRRDEHLALSDLALPY